jgi:hypothetical protein
MVKIFNPLGGVRSAHMLSSEWNKAWNGALEWNGTVDRAPNPPTPTSRAACLNYTLKNSWAVSLTVVWTPQRPPQDDKTVLYEVAVTLHLFHPIHLSFYDLSLILLYIPHHLCDPVSSQAASEHLHIAKQFCH